MHDPLARGTVAEHEISLPLASRYGFWPELLRSMPVMVAVAPTTLSGSNVPITFDGSSTAMLLNASHMPLLSSTNWLYFCQLCRLAAAIGSQMVPVCVTTLAEAPSILGMLVMSPGPITTGGGTVASGTVESATLNRGKFSSVKPTNLE